MISSLALYASGCSSSNFRLIVLVFFALLVGRRCVSNNITEDFDLNIFSKSAPIIGRFVFANNSVIDETKL